MFLKFNFRSKIFKISEKTWFYSYSENLEEFLIKLNRLTVLNKNFYLSESNIWISTRFLYMGILGNFFVHINYFPNKKNFSPNIKSVKMLEYILPPKRRCYNNYRNPLEFIKKNFFKIFCDFSNFYSTPILHRKDLMWNNSIRLIFIKNSLNYFKTRPARFVIGFTVLTDTMWLLEDQYEKIKKRKKHEKKIFFFLQLSISFLSSIQYSNRWFFANLIFYKRETLRILRKEKIKNLSNYLKILTQKKNFPSIWKISNHYMALLFINVSLVIQSYADCIHYSIQRRDRK
jgi:hypothetical protein